MTESRPEQVSAPPHTAPSELVSLAERTGYLQALRVAFAIIVLGAAVLTPSVVRASLADLTLITAGYLALSALTEGVRRFVTRRGLALVSAMLLVDGIYLAWVAYSTGGTLSPLRFLFYVHLVAVTLIASYRTGLKIALWHSILFFVVFYAQASGILDVREAAADALPGTGSSFNKVSLFNIAALWVVAVGTAAFSSLNERELRRRKGDLEGLAAMAARLEDAAEPPEIADVLLEKLDEVFGFKRGVVLGGLSGEPSLLAYRGPGEPVIPAAGVDPIVRRAWERHGPILAKQLDGDVDRRLASLLPFAKNLVIVPLFTEGRPLGALVIEQAVERGRIERRVVSMVNQFAAHAALALRNSWLLQQVQRMAETDALTGIANRRMFEHVLAREFSRAERSGEPLTLVMLDVDHFKKLNDTHGHQVGDEVLKGVARALDQRSRDFDVVARYGGEEFAVILPGCSSKEAIAVAERLRGGISEAGGELAEPITASAGVASFPSHAGDVTELIRAADEALYESKRAGRDRVTRSRRRPRRAVPASRSEA
ncbi:MAG: diguanylate cyclase [Actinomycetota bacterium]